ncbi:zf-HC2 domain-containing protein [Chitinophagales bacterium]|nr:zf-HC2 domain-containing protein [Chitinophagales bacterium]
MIEDSLIWKYIDGECSPEELQLLEKHWNQFPDERIVLEEAQVLDTNLTELPLEVPSMRFVKDVAEKAVEAKKPLLSHTQKLIVALFFITPFVLFYPLISSAGYSIMESPLQQLMTQVDIFTGGSGIIIASISFCFLLYFSVDLLVSRKTKKQVD